jgi:uncharacterized protein (DUF433 family)
MRRTASEVLRSLEMRVARLERRATVKPISGVAMGRLLDILDEIPHIDEADVQNMIQMYQAGTSLAVISAKFNISEQYVQDILAIHGIRANLENYRGRPLPR